MPYKTEHVRSAKPPQAPRLASPASLVGRHRAGPTGLGTARDIGGRRGSPEHFHTTRSHVALIEEAPIKEEEKKRRRTGERERERGGAAARSHVRDHFHKRLSRVQLRTLPWCGDRADGPAQVRPKRGPGANFLQCMVLAESVTTTPNSILSTAGTPSRRSTAPSTPSHVAMVRIDRRVDWAALALAAPSSIQNKKGAGPVEGGSWHSQKT